MERELVQLLAEGFAAFANHYGGTPQWTALAPGRVNLIGDHTDYNNGWCLPFAIDRYTVVCASLSAAKDSMLISANAPEPITIQDQAPLQPKGDWGDYVRGVMEGYRTIGCELKPLNISVSGNLPLGSGVSSSAALEVASALILERSHQLETDQQRLIKICQQAEHEFAGVPCGLLDQFSVTMAEPNSLMLFDAGEIVAEQITVDSDEFAFLLINSQVNHALSDGAYAERRAECRAAEQRLGIPLRDAQVEVLTPKLASEPTLLKRARHVVTENQRVKQMAQTLKKEQWTEAGELMFASHASLRDDFSVSCDETDTIVEICRTLGSENGVFGARMTGGGFGGSVIALIRNSSADLVKEQIAISYHEQTSIQSSPQLVKPVGGARIITQGATQ